MWKAGTALSTALSSPCVVSIGSKIIVTGGSVGNGSGQQNSNSVQMYDTESGSGWTDLAAMNDARSQHACAIVQLPGTQIRGKQALFLVLLNRFRTLIYNG